MVKKNEFMREYFVPALASLSASLGGILDLLNPILETLTLIAGLVISGGAIYKMIAKKRQAKKEE